MRVLNRERPNLIWSKADMFVGAAGVFVLRVIKNLAGI